jgi:peptidoglycan hydrolase-like protein with peptidoglycan-binding domain
MKTLQFVVGIAFALMFFHAHPVFAGDDDIYEMAPSEVYQVQVILIERGYAYRYFNLPDGKFGSKTRQAIADLQKDNGLPATGYLTEGQFSGLIKLGVPNDFMWAAVSASTDAAYQAVWNAHSGIDAFTQAVQGCRKRTRYPDKCSTVTKFRTPEYARDHGPGWVAAVKCDTSTETTDWDGIAVVSGNSKEKAIEAAYQEEASDGFDRSRCRLLVAVATDGSHQ